MSDYNSTDWVEYAHELESEVKALQKRISELDFSIACLSDACAYLEQHNAQL